MRSLILGIICLFFMGCNGHVIFQERTEIQDNNWSYNYPLEFNVEIIDENIVYDILLDIEHSREFGYANLYTGLTFISPGPDTTYQKVSIDLADKLGRWLGTCKGNECSSQLIIAATHRFKKEGINKIIVEQYSREENLPGIKSIELTIQESVE